ncbi:OmpA family protein [Mesorhizobium sp. ASY16-5R]|jgi:outer membrane protein OmpA-like peptidoglycan-associated protein|uniref:OmpA family protein n=1 Tax=Mesorhizobium sp. ASY16-5R TaxID=3445772 RepID=UPI003F9F610A
MSFHRILAGLTLAVTVFAGSAEAQQLSDHQLIASLGKVEAAAPVVDLALLMQEADANVGKGVAGLPNWSKLAQLPQFAVEIDFENDSIAIEPKSYRTIGLIADALHHPQLRHYKFLVVGHTSATGSPQHNLQLSMKRADAIMVALATTFAVPANRLVAVGVGQELPLASTDPKAASNRRVQLINLGLAE